MFVQRNAGGSVELSGTGSTAGAAESGPVGSRHVVHADDPVVAEIGDVNVPARVYHSGGGLVELTDSASAAGADQRKRGRVGAAHVVYARDSVVEIVRHVDSTARI